MSSARIHFISAGAGSGKTTRLSELLRERLTRGAARASGVIATTFTVRAATEIRERVRSDLIAAGELALAQALGAARLGTVNSICGGLLQRFAFEAGLSPDQQVIDDKVAPELLGQALDQVADGTQLAAFLAIVGRLELDVPGWNSQQPPWRKALKELVDQARSNAISAERLRALGHENAAQLLAQFPKAIEEDLDAALQAAIEATLPLLEPGGEPAAKANTRTAAETAREAHQALSQHRMPWSLWVKLTKLKPEKGLIPVVEPITAIAKRYASHPRLHADLAAYLDILFGLAADALDAYERLKRRLGALDFVDQEILLLELLDDPAISDVLRQELDLLLVDEFQDTNPIQLAVFLKLAQCAKETIWVGDIKQAIYGFRGSDTRLMEAVLARLPELGGSTEKLPYSWRSRPALVHFVNALFGEAFPPILREDVVLEAQREEYTHEPAVLDWILPGGKDPDIADSLACGIHKLLAAPPTVIDRKSKLPRPLERGDIAILCRENSGVQTVAQALRAAGIPCATGQAGLLGEPECVLALACLRRLNDPHDTVATAEILSLADAVEPETWLTDRMQWLATTHPRSSWREIEAEGQVAHPILAEIRTLRGRTIVLTPRDALELVISRCDLPRRVLQWTPDADRAIRRLANLDRLIAMSADYEAHCQSARRPGTLSGFLVWLGEEEAAKRDTLAESAGNAVQVLTHHGAKGLEWNAVILCDLDSNIRDRLWNSVVANSASGLDAAHPLHDRSLRYWPWPFGKQGSVDVADDIGRCDIGVAAQAQAQSEETRLLYVSMTRARDLLILARPKKRPNGPWMETVQLDRALPEGDEPSITLPSGEQVPFARWHIDPAVAASTTPETNAPLQWWLRPETQTSRGPLRISPSAQAGVHAKILVSVALGTRIDTGHVDDRSLLGEAIHACIAAAIVRRPRSWEVLDTQRMLERMTVGGDVDAQALTTQVSAVLDFVRQRWPHGIPLVELPMQRPTTDHAHVFGRTDLVIRLDDGWILIDHKSTPQGSAKWPALVDEHAAQLAAYAELLEAASGAPVLESWLVLPVAGAALRVELVNDRNAVQSNRHDKGTSDV